jgi:transcriptional regulator GlxA family with amidase domain
LEHHFREPITLKDIAESVSLSPSYFSDSFHKATGIPFQRYMQGLRLEFAYNLLRTSSLPVTAICFAAGFNTLTYFEKVFREKYGITPRMARK